MVKSKKIASVLASNCVSCGSCVVVCPVDAISIYKGIVAYVEVDKCVGCGACVKICPTSTISLVPRGEY